MTLKPTTASARTLEVAARARRQALTKEYCILKVEGVKSDWYSKILNERLDTESIKNECGRKRMLVKLKSKMGSI